MGRLLRLPTLTILVLLFAGSIANAQIADFTASPTSGCAPLVVSFSDNSSGTISSYNWNLGNGATPTIQNPSTSYLSPGNYTVSLTVTGPAGSNTNTKTAFITVYSKPVVSFSATTPVAGCTPHNVQFNSTVTSNSPGAATYNWDFGDGNTDTSANPAHTYVTPGAYTVSLTVTNGAGCDTTVVRNAYVTAYPVPVGGFSASQTAFCSAPATVAFTNATTGGTVPYTASWTFGDGGTGTGNAITHVYNAGGIYTVSMTVTDANGCVNTITNAAYLSVIATAPTFTAPLSVCQDDAYALFVNTTIGGGGATWNFGDGNSSTGTTAAHAYSTAGSYTVSMTTAISGCTKTATKTIIVNPKPTATISMSPSIPCPAPVPVTFAGNSTYATGYAWRWNRGGTASGQTVTKNYATHTLFEYDTVTLIATSAAGCMDTAIMDTIMIREIFTTVYPLATPAFPLAVSGCAPFDVTFGEDLTSDLPVPPWPPPFPPYPFKANSWNWDFGDGSPIATSATPTHRFVNVGTYSVRCIITTPNGCRDTAYRLVHADTPVRPSFTASPLAVCPNMPVTFINTTALPLTNTSYKWVLGADTTINKQDTSRFVYSFKYNGAKNIKLYSDHRGCVDSVSRPNYVVVNPPNANFIDSSCASPTIKFINTSFSPTSQFWDFGDGATSTVFSPTHTFPDTGTYNVMLVAYNSTYGCTDTLRKRVKVFRPFIDFTVFDSAVCLSELVQFQAAFTGSGLVDYPNYPRLAAYSWLFDAYQTPFDTMTTPAATAFQFYTRGYHDVALIVASGYNCYDTVKKSGLILISQPDVAFNANPSIGCEPLPVLFTDNSTNAPGVPNTIRRWHFGDGDTAITYNSVTTINHTYAWNGNYAVHLVVTDSLGCVSDPLSGFGYISVRKPKAAFTASDSDICVLDQVIFRDTAAGTTGIRYQWSFGDGDTATGNPVAHRYTDTGSYTVRLIVTDSLGCMDTLIRSNYIIAQSPHAAFTMSDSLAICPPLLIRFSNQSTPGSSYRWDFGTGGSPVVVTNPISTYRAAGIYTVRLVVTDINGCTDTTSAQVRVLGYSGAFTYAPLDGCVPMTVQFSTPITSIPQITWDFGDGNITTGSSTTATHTYPAPRAYVPKVIFSDGQGCSSSSIGLDTIRADEVSANFNWSVPCVGAAFSLSDSSTAVYNSPIAWTWYFGGTDTAVGTPVSYTFPTPGNHPVTLIATNATGCKDTIIRNVFINYLPTIHATDDTGVCPGDKVSLVVSGGVKYTWSPAPDSMDNCPVCDIAYVHLDTGSMVYTVTGTDTNGCVNKDSTRLIIQLKTTSSTGDGGEICVGESFRLHAEGAHTYEWLPASTIDSPFIASPLATPQMTTTYIVAAREGTCLIDSQHVRVVVHSLPVFSAGLDEIISLGSAVTLMPTRSGIARIEWRADTTLSCVDCFRPNAYPLYTTTYYATGYNEFGCSVTDSVTVHVRCNGSLVFVPNTFTPNGDGQNDYFFPRGKGIDQMSSFRIFNRWGELLFERSGVALNDERAGWDGTYKGRALPPDVYVYTMQSNCKTGEPLSWKGDVTLMR